jgi:hypothetical protein
VRAAPAAALTGRLWSDAGADEKMVTMRRRGGQRLRDLLPVLIMVGTVLFAVAVASLSAGPGWPRALVDLRPYA